MAEIGILQEAKVAPMNDITKTQVVSKTIMEHLLYKSDMVNSKSFIGKVLLRIKWKFELNKTL